MDGRTNERTNGRTDGRTDGQSCSMPQRHAPFRDALPDFGLLVPLGPRETAGQRKKKRKKERKKERKKDTHKQTN